jgi:hypothetical protein
MVSRRAARMHARTPVRRYSTVAILPAERPLQGLHWRSRSYSNGEMGMETIQRGLKQSESRHVAESGGGR